MIGAGGPGLSDIHRMSGVRRSPGGADERMYSDSPSGTEPGRVSYRWLICCAGGAQAVQNDPRQINR